MCVSVSVGARARVWPGIPAVPGRERRGRGKAAPSGPLAAGPAPRRAFGSPLPGRSPESAWPPRLTALAKPGSWGVLLPRSPPKKRKRKARRPPSQLRDLFLASQRDAAAPTQAEDAWSSGGRKRLPPAAALPGGGPRQTPQSPGGGAERGHPLPERTATNKAEIGVWLVTGEPAVARAAVRGAGTSLSARSRASGAAGESIIHISAAASSSPVPSAGYGDAPSAHRRADTHTPAQRVCSEASPCASPPPYGNPLF